MDERALFGKACQEAFLRQCEDDIASWTEPVKLSYSFYKKCSKIIGVNVIPQKYTVRRTFVLIAAAVLLLLTACAAYIYRDDIKGLFVECLNDHDKVCAEKAAEGFDAKFLEDVYYLTYVPEGYELVESEINSMKTYYKYSKGNESTIIYTQKSTLANEYINKKNAKGIFARNVPYDIYYLQTNQLHCYVWYDGDFYNELIFNKAISDNELENIINGITAKK